MFPFPMRNGGKDALLEGEWELSLTTLRCLYLLPFFFLISSSGANRVELITETCESEVLPSKKEVEMNNKLSSKHQLFLGAA